jgi:hypothetical protein
VLQWIPPTALRAEGFSKARASQVQGWIDHDWIPNEVTYPGGGGSEVRLGPDAYEIVGADQLPTP